MTNTAIAARRSFESDNAPLFDLADLGAIIVEHDSNAFGPLLTTPEYSSMAFREECDAAIDSLDWAFDCYGDS